MRNRGKIKRLLRRTGWLQVAKSQVDNIADDDPRFIQAVKEYTEFHPDLFHRCCRKHNGVMGTHDGIIGPGSEEMFGSDRCGEPDRPVFGKPAAATAEASARSWKKGCIPGWEDVHTFVVDVDKSNMPAFLGAKDDPNSIMEQAWELMRLSYWNIGLAVLRSDIDSRYASHVNSRMTFTNLRGSTIGLAIVGNNPKCGSTIWMKYDRGYSPSDLVSEWSTLFRHEGGHNVGLSHFRGGTMNSSILRGLDDPDQWRNDPAFGQLEKWFTGVAVIGGPGGGPDDPPPPTGGTIHHFTGPGQEAWDKDGNFLGSLTIGLTPPPTIGG